jgi:hypothetical protein
VIADEPETHRLRTALAAAGIATAAADDLAAEARVTVLPATVAKGLEYDHVVVAEPAAIAAAEARGLHRLYVVLTRAVSRLDVLHSRPLPPEFGLEQGVLAQSCGCGRQTPTVPSIPSRRKSAWPLWRAYSWIRCSITSRSDTSSPHLAW